MKVRQLSSTKLAAGIRLDARYYVDRAMRASFPSELLGARGRAWMPGRQKVVRATALEDRMPYLRPYDIFDYLPRPADFVSEQRTENAETYRVKAGQILQTCSGRNLGPCTLADEFLGRFVVSNDLIRIDIDDAEQRHATYAYLRSPYGQAALRRGRSGSVVDHISPDQVNGLPVPVLPGDLVKDVSALIGEAFRKRQGAREVLHELTVRLETNQPRPERRQKLRDGYAISAMDLSGRLDAAYYDPMVRELRRDLRDAGAVAVESVARVVIPHGRFRPRYVAAPHGTPMLSGGQMLQEQPVNLRHVAASTFSDITKLQVMAGSILYQAEGRAEQGIGIPVEVVPSRDGWVCNWHVGRVIPHEPESAGRIFLALNTLQARVQLQATASGSVQDSTFAEDMERVLVVLPDVADGAAADEAWIRFDEAFSAEREAVSLVTRWVAAQVESESAA